MSDDDDDRRWWFCLKHQEAEQGVGCANAERLGPYDSRADAEQALAKAAERTEAWESDPRWNDDE